MTLTFYSWRWWKPSSFTPWRPEQQTTRISNIKIGTELIQIVIFIKLIFFDPLSNRDRNPGSNIPATNKSSTCRAAGRHGSLEDQSCWHLCRRIRLGLKFRDYSQEYRDCKSQVRGWWLWTKDNITPTQYLGKMDILGAQNFCEMHL